MSEYIYKEYTERNLPHYQPPDTTIFVTFRLADTVPRATLRLYYAKKLWFEEETKRLSKLKLQEHSPEIVAHEQRLREFRREWFVKFEEILDKAENGPTWLKETTVAEVVKEALHHRDGSVYRLAAYCIMFNHVHALFAPYLTARELHELRLPEGLRFISEHPPLNRIMQSLKGWTAWRSNRVLGRKGTFWEQESYDHAVRDEAEFERTVRYILNNPVKAGLVQDWSEWPWSYRREPATPAEQEHHEAVP